MLQLNLSIQRGSLPKVKSLKLQIQAFQKSHTNDSHINKNLNQKVIIIKNFKILISNHPKFEF